MCIKIICSDLLGKARKQLLTNSETSKPNAVTKTIGERAPALYDQNAQLQLALAFTKFGVSGHNIESVLDAYLHKPDEFFNGAVKMTITPRMVEIEAEQFIESFGAENSVIKSIEAGITKFAGGAMTALEKKYRPANDGVRPPNVSEEQFANDPTIGKSRSCDLVMFTHIMMLKLSENILVRTGTVPAIRFHGRRQTLKLIWLVEKDTEQASRAYPLTDCAPRKHEALERGYLFGRYGAIPILEHVKSPLHGKE
jgi:hypothetical protein